MSAKTFGSLAAVLGLAFLAGCGEGSPGLGASGGGAAPGKTSPASPSVSSPKVALTPIQPPPVPEPAKEEPKAGKKKAGEKGGNAAKAGERKKKEGDKGEGASDKAKEELKGKRATLVLLAKVEPGKKELNFSRLKALQGGAFTITKADGSTVEGTAAEAGPKGVVLKGSGGDVTIENGDIKEISWKAEGAVAKESANGIEFDLGKRTVHISAELISTIQYEGEEPRPYAPPRQTGEKEGARQEGGPQGRGKEKYGRHRREILISPPPPGSARGGRRFFCLRRIRKIHTAPP